MEQMMISGISFTIYPKLPWDGSHLGSITDSMILGNSVWRAFEFFWVDFHPLNFRKEIVIMKYTRDKYPCIVDEVKEYLNLDKTGTHTVSFQGKLRLLIKPYTYNRLIPIQDERIRKLFVFRDIMGSSITCGGILINNGIPVSHSENYNKLVKRKKSLTSSILDTWFVGYNVDEIAKELFRKKFFVDDTFCEILKFREFLESIILRIDPKLIWITSCVIDRLTNRIC